MLAHAFADAGAVGRPRRPLGRRTEAGDARSSTTAAAPSAYVAADVTDADELSRAIAELEERLGPIDLLVNNAGIAGPIGPMWENDPTTGGEPSTSTCAASCNASQQRAPGHDRPPARSDHQHHQPGRRTSLAAGVVLLGLEGRGHQAHREPRPRDQPTRRQRLQRASRTAPDRPDRDRHRRPGRRRPRRSHPTLEPRRAPQRPRRRPRRGRRARSCASRSATPTRSPGDTSPCTTTSTSCWPESMRCANATCSSCGRNASPRQPPHRRKQPVMNTSTTHRAAATPAYFLGRPASRWLAAIHRSDRPRASAGTSPASAQRAALEGRPAGRHVP